SPGEDHLLGTLRAHAASEKAVRPHSREQVEQDLRKAHLGAALRDHHVAGQRSFEAAAQRIPLDERYRGEGRVVVADASEDVVDAKGCIIEQTAPIMGEDELRERRKVTTEVVDSAGPGGEYVVRGAAHGSIERNIAAAHFERVVVAPQVVQQPSVE